MLVLSRKRGEKIMVGSDVVITVLDFYGPNVQIGISAPPDVVIHRQEVADRIEQERRERDGDQL